MAGVLVAGLLSLAAIQPTPYEQGVAARRAGDIKEAVVLLREAVSEQPADADAWVQYGYALRDAGRVREARDAFDRAIALAPQYEDARVGRASLPVARPVVSVDGSWVKVEGADDWREGRLGLSVPVGGTMVGGSLEASRRFGLSDVYGELRVDARTGRGGYYALLGATPGADYRARWQVGAGGALSLRRGSKASVATLDVRLADYPTGTVATLSPGLEQYLAGGKTWVTAKWINTFSDGRHAAGGLGRIDTMASEGVRLFGGFARAPDLDQGQAIQTSSLFGGAAIDVSERLEWRVSVAHEAPENGVDRTGLSTGLSLRLP